MKGGGFHSNAACGRLSKVLRACLPLLLFCSCGGGEAQTRGVAQGQAPAVLKFPQGWRVKGDGPPEFYVQQLEVRRPPDAPAGEFFFAALPYGDNDYAHELYPDIPGPAYSTNRYAVNFDRRLGVRAVSPDEWGRARRILSKPRHVFAKEGAEVVEYRGLKFARSGRHWGEAALSPRGKWLAVFSYNGEKPEPSLFNFLGGGEPRRGDVFWDVYDAETGAKVLAWGARDVEDPTSFARPAVWVEERYLLMPQDRLAQTFLVGALPDFAPRQNPVTVTLPARVGEDGRIPAPAQNEAWAPLAPLTKEQAARITAPSPPEYVEWRRPRDSSAGEVLLALREETDNRTRHLPGRDGAGEYNYRQWGTYYYAVSPGAGPTARFATKEEWERAAKVGASRRQVTLEETRDTTGGRRREYRPFPKTGETWGTPRALAGGEWVAVFSYTRGAAGGVMFVDIYSRRSGALMLSSQTPFSGSADALFGAAVWVEGEYLVVPLGASLESFRVWTLPGGVD